MYSGSLKRGAGSETAVEERGGKEKAMFPKTISRGGEMCGLRIT